MLTDKIPSWLKGYIKQVGGKLQWQTDQDANGNSINKLLSLEASGGIIHFSSSYSTLQAALDALSEGDTLIIDKFHDAKSEVDGGYTFSTSNVTIKALTKDDGIDASDTSLGGIDALGFSGSGKTGISDNLQSNASEGGNTLDIPSDGSYEDYSVGDLVLIESDEKFAAASGRNATFGELAYIASTSAGQLTLTHSLHADYTTAENAKVTKISVLENITINGLRIIGQGETANNVDAGIVGEWVDNLEIRKCLVEDFEHVGIDVKNSINFDIHNNKLLRMNSDNYGYGILTSQVSQDGEVHHNKIYGARNGYDVSNSGSDPGIPRNITIHHNIITGCSLNGLNSHSVCDIILFENNTLIGNSISLAGPRMEARGNIINSEAIAVGNRSDQPTEIKVIDNTIRNLSSGEAIEIAPNNAPSENFIDIINNSINVSVRGIIVDYTSDRDCQNLTIKNNTFKISGADAIFARYLDHFTFSENNIQISTDDVAVAIRYANNIEVNNNNVVGPGTGSSTDNAIVFAYPSDGVLLVGNIISGFDTGIGTPNDVSNGLVDGNNCANCTTSTDLGTGTTAGDNI